MTEKQKYKYTGEYPIIIYTPTYAGKVLPGDVVFLTETEISDLGSANYVKISEPKQKLKPEENID